RANAQTEVVAGDVAAPATLGPALEGVSTAYYLIHSMGAAGHFVTQDRAAAEAFGAAARAAGVRRIVYLGGLGGETELSEHLASRQEVGRVLAASGVPVIEFRASIIIGSGSFSFEMVRALSERLPVMVTPRWVRTPAQPIAIEDVLSYLLAALDAPPDVRGVFEIGGADRTSYLGVMEEYSRQRGLRRLMIPVPFLTPTLSSLWLRLITPLYAPVGRALIEGVRNETVVRDDRALRVFPVRPRGLVDAVRRALENEDGEFAATRWSDTFAYQSSEAAKTYRTRVIDSRAARVRTTAEAAFRPIERIGGSNGWYFGGALWWLRGWLDILVGGPGLRRGRRDPAHLRPGDTLDFWRVEACEPPRLLRLRAEMRLPGRAWLQFEVADVGIGEVEIRQTALFDPKGVFGRLYWYALVPLHALVFGGMLRGIVRQAAPSAEPSVREART
ncbi:MAG TPA: SDR family oxidoreductase, partial [Candidatus Eisenbacteria bacterium]|nr:SDR family oxidoreductase [Candidatus Eisenbacteria bacterium]